MKLKLSALGAGLGLLLATMPAVAHHQFTMGFDATRPITLTGTLTRVDWVHPHGWLYINARNPDGSTVNWTIEIASPNALRGRGLLRTDFPVGREVVVTGYRAKNNAPVVLGWTLMHPDGRSLPLTGPDGSDAPEREVRTSPN
ncbi:MAG: hypothetical protein HYU37_06445 [Acidobacteria bacterium]|nr:hypothetical protein [Acidobacteriota bacterium]